MRSTILILATIWLLVAGYVLAQIPEGSLLRSLFASGSPTRPFSTASPADLSSRQIRCLSVVVKLLGQHHVQPPVPVRSPAAARPDSVAPPPSAPFHQRSSPQPPHDPLPAVTTHHRAADLPLTATAAAQPAPVQPRLPSGPIQESAAAVTHADLAELRQGLQDDLTDTLRDLLAAHFASSTPPAQSTSSAVHPPVTAALAPPPAAPTPTPVAPIPSGESLVNLTGFPWVTPDLADKVYNDTLPAQELHRLANPAWLLEPAAPEPSSGVKKQA
ncbi:hypothetical protein [Sporisorium scitamineum]|uniref:Uncharacterized protein n=1 Tax=Sporisorium scitamineum TaxID=49012 RepID=A0A0F7RXV4_9BASI|nr:hypothetical protein [Sporisorium scitamineum]